MEMEGSILKLTQMLCLDYEESVRESTSFVRLLKCHYSGGSQQWKWIPTKQQQVLFLSSTQIRLLLMLA